RGVAEHAVDDETGTTVTEGACERDVIGLQRLDRGLTGMERNRWNRDDAEGDGGEHEMADAIDQADLSTGRTDGNRAADRRDAQLHREDRQQQQTEPERGSRGERVREPA